MNSWENSQIAPLVPKTPAGMKRINKLCTIRAASYIGNAEMELKWDIGTMERNGSLW